MIEFSPAYLYSLVVMTLGANMGQFMAVVAEETIMLSICRLSNGREAVNEVKFMGESQFNCPS